MWQLVPEVMLLMPERAQVMLLYGFPALFRCVGVSFI